MYLAFFILLATRNAKTYYAGPIYPLMLAGGAVAVEQLLRWTRRAWPRTVAASALVLTGAATAPMTLPVLPVETFIRYQEVLLGGPPGSSEQKDVGALPQQFADMFGYHCYPSFSGVVFFGDGDDHLRYS